MYSTIEPLLHYLTIVMQPLLDPNWTRGMLFTLAIDRVMTAKSTCNRQIYQSLHIQDRR